MSHNSPESLLKDLLRINQALDDAAEELLKMARRRRHVFGEVGDTVQRLASDAALLASQLGVGDNP